MRTMKIDKNGGNPMVFFDKRTDKVVKCAFNRNDFCSPDCAACHIFGSDPKAECYRNGNDNTFIIGRVEGV